MTVTRLLTIDDASAIAQLYRANRDFLAPWEPVRPDAFYTIDGQRAVVQSALDRLRAGQYIRE
jgi:[ribosomal protein S5]-alanine N-acetyltransferase